MKREILFVFFLFLLKSDKRLKIVEYPDITIKKGKKFPDCSRAFCFISISRYCLLSGSDILSSCCDYRYKSAFISKPCEASRTACKIWFWKTKD